MELDVAACPARRGVEAAGELARLEARRRQVLAAEPDDLEGPGTVTRPVDEVLAHLEERRIPRDLEPASRLLVGAEHELEAAVGGDVEVGATEVTPDPPPALDPRPAVVDRDVDVEERRDIAPEAVRGVAADGCEAVVGDLGRVVELAEAREVGIAVDEPTQR